jgi:ribosomal protein S27AE
MNNNMTEKRIGMRKLICTECGAIWYTSNTSDSQICGNCEGTLEEVKDKEVDIEIS